jgi:phosphoglycerol transferase MdoB-like AlkP superfamily enzyme
MRRPSIKNSFLSSESLLLPAVFLYFLLLTFFLKTIFIVKNWSFLKPDGFGELTRALFVGMRFDISILAYFFIPAVFLYHLLVLKKTRLTEWIFEGYFIAVAFFILVFWFADIQYFEEAGKHFTYEAFAYIGTVLPTIVFGAFKLHPLLSLLSMLCSLALAFITGRTIKSYIKIFVPLEKKRSFFYSLATFIIMLALMTVAARGGPQSPSLRLGDSCISTSPYINAVCLNPIYSIFTSTFLPSEKFTFSTEEANVRTIRELLDIGQASFVNKDYPLLRISKGTEGGNRKNVVIFILESWSGKDIGCLGSGKNVTPFFDALSRQGTLFTNFFATGVRTAEGVFSVLCSFPNQPIKPIMDRPVVYQTRWRPLSQILAETGYQTLFVHGASLNFDSLSKFLKYIGFKKVIDKRKLSPHVPYNSPLGYHDEDVMRKADEEFDNQNGNPFLGVIYTINTHPPFPIPKGFPEAYPPTDISNKYFNSLKYSDHALEIFFNLAKTRPYFKDTIFIFVSDHSRTRDKVNLFDQHHIPMLVYSPGYIQPGINSVAGSQLDLLPTILGLLQLRTPHSSWGRNLFEVSNNSGFAASVAGNEVRWHDSTYLLNDSLTGTPMLFNILRDKACNENIWSQEVKEGEILETRTRSFISLSQQLMYENRVYPLSFK